MRDEIVELGGKRYRVTDYCSFREEQLVKDMLEYVSKQSVPANESLNTEEVRKTLVCQKRGAGKTAPNAVVLSALEKILECLADSDEDGLDVRSLAGHVFGTEEPTDLMTSKISYYMRRLSGEGKVSCEGSRPSKTGKGPATLRWRLKV